MAAVPVVLFAACAEEDLSTSLSALMTVLSDLFGDGYASHISHATEIETVIFLLGQAEAPLSVYKVRLWLAHYDDHVEISNSLFGGFLEASRKGSSFAGPSCACCKVVSTWDHLRAAWPGANA